MGNIGEKWFNEEYVYCKQKPVQSEHKDNTTAHTAPAIVMFVCTFRHVLYYWFMRI